MLQNNLFLIPHISRWICLKHEICNFLTITIIDSIICELLETQLLLSAKLIIAAGGVNLAEDFDGFSRILLKIRLHYQLFLLLIKWEYIYMFIEF